MFDFCFYFESLSCLVIVDSNKVITFLHLRGVNNLKTLRLTHT